METSFLQLDKCDISIQSSTPTINGIEQQMETILIIDGIDKRDIQKGALVMELTPENAVQMIKMLSESIMEVMNQKI